MPAKQAYIATSHSGDEILKITAEGDLEKRRSVYFTDQSPIFTLNAENISDKSIEGRTRVRIVFDESSSSYERELEVIDCNLDPGENTNVEFELEMLAYQGNAAIGVERLSATESDGVYDTHTYATDRIERIYTFMVYDRDYYKVGYLRPRYAQYIASGLAVLIVLVGILQIIS